MMEIRTVSGGPLEVNTYVAGPEGGNSCVLIDPGAEEASVQDAVGARRVTAVLLTHAHFDHMLHAKPWLERGAKLYVHRLDAPALCDAKLNLSWMIGETLLLPKADVLLEEGSVVSEAGLSLRVLHTPGHTPGGVCYAADDVLFCGDTMFYRSYGRVDLPGGDMAQIMASLTRLKELSPETIVYPGHGMKTKIAWERGTGL